MTDPLRWQQVERLFQRAMELDTSARTDFLEENCDKDTDLRREVESLLQYSDGAETFLETPALVADHIGPYRLIGTIASGGMGVVHEAEQQNPRRVVALKVMRKIDADDPARIALFDREAASLARLRHPGIASIYDAGVTDAGEHYFAMELVRGESLTRHARKRELPVRERLELFIGVCDPISYAHQRGVIHRDLKPSNILVAEPPASETGTSLSRGIVKVLDFGIARILDSEQAADTTISGAGRLFGTLNYMSPEQARGNPDDIDTRTDVYSLGVVLHELLTGEVPIDVSGMALHEGVKTICDSAPRKLGSRHTFLRGDLEIIIQKAIAKAPSERYQSVAELSEDIRRYLHGQPILAHAPSSIYQLRKLIGRHKLVVASGCVALIAVVSFAIAVTVLMSRLSNEHLHVLAAKSNEQRARSVAEHVSQFLEEMLTSARPDVALGREVTVREILDMAAIRITPELTEDPAVAAAIERSIGSTYHSLGRHEEAERHLRIALERQRSLHDDKHPEVVECMIGLAKLLIDRASYEEAEVLCVRAVESSGAQDDQSILLQAAALNTRATLHQARGSLREAEVDFRESLRIRQSAAGTTDRDIATSLNNLAALLQQMGHYVEAERLHRNALVIRTSLFGDTHPDVATSMNNIGNLLLDQGKFSEARKTFVDTIKLQRILHGETHPLLAMTLNNLGLSNRRLGDLDAAEVAYRDAIRILELSYDATHPHLAKMRGNLGVVLYNKGKLKDSEALLRLALDARRAIFESPHLDIAQSLSDLAAVLAAQDDVRQAESLYQEAIEMYTQLGYEHLNVGVVKNNVASLMFKLDQFHEAEESYRASIRSFRAADLPPNHPYLVSPYRGLGKTLIKLERFDEAIIVLQETLQICTSSSLSNAKQVAGIEMLIGECLIRQDRRAEADATLKSALTRLKESEPGNQSLIRKIKGHMALLESAEQ